MRSRALSDLKLPVLPPTTRRWSAEQDVGGWTLVYRRRRFKSPVNFLDFTGDDGPRLTMETGNFGSMDPSSKFSKSRGLMGSIISGSLDDPKSSRGSQMGGDRGTILTPSSSRELQYSYRYANLRRLGFRSQ